jgi:hypothetical protein
MTVMATTSILFVLATTLMMMVAYQSQATTLRTSRLRATHVADAGINAYLFSLKSDYGYYKDAPDTGWVTIGDNERYRVTAVPAADGHPLTLRSTGVAGGGTVTIAATIRFPSYADYMFLTNSDLSVAGDADIKGQVRSNGDIFNQGKIEGKVMSGGTVSGNGSFDRGYAQNQPIVDFNQVLAAMDDMMVAARASSTYFPPSGASGYMVTVSGNVVTVASIDGGTTTGDFVTTPVSVFNVPASGVVYFADDVWVSGAYSSPLTIVSDSDMYLIGDYGPSDANTTATSGLIAKGNIIVPAWYKSVKTDMTIDAALMSQSGRIYADIKQGVIRDRITITGALTAFDAGGTWGSVDSFTGQPVAGFRQNVYTYDQRLNAYPPPMYPVVLDGSLKVDTWLEDKTQAF